ncbi:hypothetical protein N7532_010854 [Penicillium argentinense]|uniref:F-box domain-containing protein n=1 Tax=Penicillium argentinense TaxID=1131581 RepID=A0A9W9JYB9_9EURO|nr:uncharacterized protein N7532_010854 [Penicillium argentinense]KAJ5086083.1 hypothetical protein N7532_010854 [Penicillium argentinense]
MASAVQGTDDLAFLPRDIFWLVLAYLAPRDLVRCRRVSRAWNEAFGNPAILVPLMKRHFPRTREVQGLHGSSADRNTIRIVFDQVASRYDHLERGKPRSVHKYRLCDDFGASGEREWYQVQPWESHASHVRQLVDRQFSEAMWSHDQGLLVFPSAEHQGLVLMDLSNDRQFVVPLTITGKVVRRVRLQKQLLVVEWAEPKAFHWLNDSDGVHRHFASSFDVKPSETGGGWDVTPRNEWKIMFLGHPLSERDRFFSSHSNTHYVIYIWQPNRSLYTADEDAPIESLFVWDISKPSSYQPSLDPTGKQHDAGADDSPTIVTRFGFRDLEFFGVRQRGCPSVQRLDVTDDGLAVEITENINTWLTDPDPLGLPMVITTSIPMQGQGPHWRQQTDLILPAYRGNCSLQTSPMSVLAIMAECWYGTIAQVIDQAAGVSFCLHFDPARWDEDRREPDQRDQTINLTFQVLGSYEEPSQVTAVNQDFTGRGRICGSERYLLGENRNRELVIYRFDR